MGDWGGSQNQVKQNDLSRAMNKKYVLYRCVNVIDISFGRVFIPLNHPSCVYRP